MSDFSIVAVIISLMALDSAFGPMAGWRVHNQIFESQLEPFHQRSPNLILGLPRLAMCAWFCFAGTHFHYMSSFSNSLQFP